MVSVSHPFTSTNPPWADATQDLTQGAEVQVAPAPSSYQASEQNAYPAYAATTLAYGLQVDAKSLLYSSRAYYQQRAGWDLLQACSKGTVKCGGQASIAVLPNEILDNITEHFRKLALAEAECESWLYLGEEGQATYHPAYCCQKDENHVWPAQVQEEWLSALESFQDHFSMAVPRCARPCNTHHACEVSPPHFLSYLRPGSTK